MPKLIHSMTQSLDGFIADRNGSIDWSVPDEELHQFHNDRVREIGTHLLGRRLYEVMLYWETAADAPDASDIEIEFAGIWQSIEKVVFSTTLEEVEGTNTRLATGSVAEEVAALKAQTGKDIAVGGAGLAASCIDLIDEFELFVAPVVLGGGTPYFPAVDERLDLELLETRTFSSRVVYLHYRRV